jgi:hypothetical protein
MGVPIIVRCPSAVVRWKGVQPGGRRRAAADPATVPMSRIEAGS